MKDFLDQNREGFDSLQPSDDLWTRIENDLEEPKEVCTVPMRYLWYTVGAAACVVAILSSVILFQPEPEVVAEQPNQEVEAPSFSLADVSEELAEVELYYASEVNAKIEAVKEYDESEEFLEDIEFLRTEFEALREEMGRGADQHKIIEAMIENYRLRLEILEDLLDELEDNGSQVAKNTRYEV